MEVSGVASSRATMTRSTQIASRLPKVAVINTNYTGGGAAAVARIISHEVRRLGQFDSKILYSFGNGGPQETSQRVGAEWKKAVASLAFRMLSDADWVLRGNTSRYLKQIREVDLLHLHNLHGYYLNPMQFLAQVRQPFVWTLHDSWLLSGRCILTFNCERWRSEGCRRCPDLGQVPKTWLFDKAARELQQKRIALQQLLQRTNGCLVAPSHWLAKRILCIGVDARVVKVIHNPVDTATFVPVSDKKSLRCKLNLPLDKKLVMFSAARLNDPLKGIRYMRQLQEHFLADSTIHFVSVGTVSTELPLTNTTLLGYINSAERLAEVYAACDLFVSTSLSENFPMCVLEAMSAGTPVAAFEVGGIPEQVCSETGRLVALGDVDGLIRTIDDLFVTERQGLLSKMGHAARSKCLRFFSKDRIVAQYMELYDEVLTSVGSIQKVA